MALFTALVTACRRGRRALRTLERDASCATTAAQLVLGLGRARRSFATAPRLINEDVLRAAQEKQTGVSLHTLLTFGRAAEAEPAKGDHPVRDATVLTSSQFLHKELPIRLAQRMVELEHLPGGLSGTPSVRHVSSWYVSSFNDIRAHPLPTDAATEASFTRLLASIYERHAPTVVTMARGLVELRRALHLQPRDPLPEGLATPLQQWLDIFFLARLGLRTLIAQHIAMHEPRPGYIGIISPTCSPRDVIESAAADAKDVCLQHYSDVPSVHVSGDLSLTFPYVPLMLRHIVFELLKNSLRATIERHEGGGGVGPLPPVDVIIASSEGGEDVAIKIADKGGGISRSGMQRIFGYLYTTAKAPVDLEDEAGPDFSTRAPMAGLGFGLPISRVFARYFGGDLHILSMQGHGTDVYIYLRRLGDASEPLSEASPTIAGFARALARGAGTESDVFASLKDSIYTTPGDSAMGLRGHASFKVNVRTAGPGHPS